MIPILSSTPELNAEYYVDVDVVRVPAEILDTLRRAERIASSHIMRTLRNIVPEQCDPIIPAWAASSAKNYEFLVAHALAICDEHKYRFRKVHAMRRLIERHVAVPQAVPVSGPLTLVPVQVDNFKWNCDQVTPEQAHRRWYVFGRSDKDHHWTRRRCPKWFARMMALGWEATESLDVVF